MRLPSPKQYPKSVIVGDLEYLIKFVRRIDGKDTVGECDPSTKVIKIKQKQTHADTFYTFIHEVLHAMEAEYNIKVPHKVIYKLEKAIGDFLIVNNTIQKDQD